MRRWIVCASAVALLASGWAWASSQDASAARCWRRSRTCRVRTYRPRTYRQRTYRQRTYKTGPRYIVRNRARYVVRPTRRAYRGPTYVVRHTTPAPTYVARRNYTTPRYVMRTPRSTYVAPQATRAVAAAPMWIERKRATVIPMAPTRDSYVTNSYATNTYVTTRARTVYPAPPPSTSAALASASALTSNASSCFT